jgi:asparagine synthase (glutamine-hydrolysing)
MSGIAGIIHFDGAPVEPGQVEKMTAAMAHRGPDGIHHWVRGSVALGQCMLRTTPESLEETQPLTNEDASLVLVMDGRVDNWEELRRELLGRGAVLRTRADAELVLRAYEIWGPECLSHIDGDFALVIWDARNRTAFCARDRMGNKPLHYHWDGKTLAFASELHAILALPWVREVPNEGMLAEMLAWECHSRDETLWQGVMRLVAAHRMVVDEGGPQPEQYWAPDLWATLPYTKDEDYIEHYRELLADAVRRMSRSHRPLACDVSGGLDSSAIFCMAESLRQGGRLHASNIEGYTLAFTDESEANELAYARAAGDFLGKAVREITPTILPLDWYVENAQAYREFPGFPNGSMSIGLRQQAAQDGSRVMFSGEWGDAWLQGSRSYYAEELSQGHLRALYDCFRTDAVVAGPRQASKWFLRHGLFPLLPSALQHGLRGQMRKIRGCETRDDLYWLSPAKRELIQFRREKFGSPHRVKVRSHSQYEQLEILNDALTSQVLERLERLGSQAGLEMRHPFSDTRIVQMAFSTPQRLRLRGDRSKYIHVQAMRDLMPQAILDRKTKAEFSIVFRGYLDKMTDRMTDTLPAERPGWVAQKGLARLYRFYRDSPQYGWPLWVLWGIHASDAVFNKGCCFQQGKGNAEKEVN